MTKWILIVALAMPLLAQAGPKTSPPLPLLLLPATGYWYDADRPGTGFALQHRGPLLGLVIYHFSDAPDVEPRQPDWHLAAGPLEGDTFEAPLLHFSGGSCLACDPFAAADAEVTDVQVRLVFSSAREAMLQIGEAQPRRVVSLPYGVPYEAALPTPADLPLPDLRGRWLLAQSGVEGEFSLQQREVGEGSVVFRGPADGFSRTHAALQCDGGGCTLRLESPGQAAMLPLHVANFRLGDIAEYRMTGADSMTFPVQAFRIVDREDRS